MFTLSFLFILSVFQMNQTNNLLSVLSRQKSSKCHQIKTVKARSLICIANFFNALILYSTLSNVTTRGVETLASPGKRSLNIGLCRKNCRHKSLRRKGLSLELQCPPHHQKCLVYVWVWRKQWRRLWGAHGRLLRYVSRYPFYCVFWISLR